MAKPLISIALKDAAPCTDGYVDHYVRAKTREMRIIECKDTSSKVGLFGLVKDLGEEGGRKMCATVEYGFAILPDVSYSLVLGDCFRSAASRAPRNQPYLTTTRDPRILRLLGPAQARYRYLLLQR